MPKREIRFIGLLANVDSSILNLNLLDRGFKDRGFKVETMSREEAIELISDLTALGGPHRRVRQSAIDFIDEHGRILHELNRIHCINYSEGKVYFISKSYERTLEGRPIPILPPECDSDGKYATSLVRLMRLFKAGNICLPCQYYYYTDKLRPSEHSASFYEVEGEPYTLESSEIPDLQIFIQDTKLPFKKLFLQLAFENFELSYRAFNTGLSFLLSMISLETLFSPGGQGELRYRISRNVATLLGRNKKDSNEIYFEIKGLYDKRSELVHNGKLDIITPEHLMKLRHYVRESIKEINKTGMDKEELLELLNSCGFGERPWTV